MGGHHPDEATYWRLRRARKRAQRRADRLAGIPSTGGNGRDPFDSDAIRKNAADLRAMEQLPMLQWPSDLYGQYVSLEELLADDDFAPAKIGRVKVDPDDLCGCGCGKRHNNNVSMTINSLYGHGFHVRYFWSEECKSKFVRVRAAKLRAAGK
ncbi:MAG: hypothetical protein KGJ90_02045 [Patescibacteria group bacterium]|nr:hypothetical protein [Patescibacteria group bacterium]